MTPARKGRWRKRTAGQAPKRRRLARLLYAQAHTLPSPKRLPRRSPSRHPAVHQGVQRLLRVCATAVAGACNGCCGRVQRMLRGLHDTMGQPWTTQRTALAHRQGRPIPLPEGAGKCPPQKTSARALGGMHKNRIFVP